MTFDNGLYTSMDVIETIVFSGHINPHKKLPGKINVFPKREKKCSIVIAHFLSQYRIFSDSADSDTILLRKDIFLITYFSLRVWVQQDGDSTAVLRQHPRA